MNTSENQDTIFSKGQQAPAKNFTGIAWVNRLIPGDNPFQCSIGNVVFEPGCRNSWHSHPGGQVLLCTSGVGYFQERGKPIQLLRKGDVVQIYPDVVHWHGATPNGEFTHIAIATNTLAGETEWLEPVTDEEYDRYLS